MGAPTRHRGRSRYPTRSRNAGATGAAPATFDPLVDITWAAAYFAEDPDWVAPADGAAVSQWDDGSGNGLHATQGTPADRPLYRAAVVAMNNQPGVEFASTDNLVVGAFTAVSVPYSIVILGRTSNVGVTQEWVTAGTGTDPRVGHTATPAWFWDPSTLAGTGGTPNTNAHLLTAIATAGNDTLQVDGTAVISGSDRGGASVAALRLAGSVGFLGVLSFVGLYAGDITSDGAWADFKTWAAAHYAITIA